MSRSRVVKSKSLINNEKAKVTTYLNRGNIQFSLDLKPYIKNTRKLPDQQFRNLYETKLLGYTPEIVAWVKINYWAKTDVTGGKPMLTKLSRHYKGLGPVKDPKDPLWLAGYQACYEHYYDDANAADRRIGSGMACPMTAEIEDEILLYLTDSQSRFWNMDNGVLKHITPDAAEEKQIQPRKKTVTKPAVATKKRQHEIIPEPVISSDDEDSESDNQSAVSSIQSAKRVKVTPPQPEVILASLVAQSAPTSTDLPMQIATANPTAEDSIKNAKAQLQKQYDSKMDELKEVKSKIETLSQELALLNNKNVTITQTLSNLDVAMKNLDSASAAISLPASAPKVTALNATSTPEAVTPTVLDATMITPAFNPKMFLDKLTGRTSAAVSPTSRETPPSITTQFPLLNASLSSFLSTSRNASRAVLPVSPLQSLPQLSVQQSTKETFSTTMRDAEENIGGTLVTSKKRIF